MLLICSKLRKTCKNKGHFLQFKMGIYPCTNPEGFQHHLESKKGVENKTGPQNKNDMFPD